MTVSTILAKSFQVTALASALALVGCGGGGGSDDNLCNFKAGGCTSSETTVATVNIGNISLTGTGTATQGFIPSNGATAVVKVTDANGVGISGAVVTFSATGGVTLDSTNGAVLTDAEGNASIFVKPTDINDNGTYSLSAKTTHNGVTATTSDYNFSLRKTNLAISNLKTDIGTDTLKAGGSTTVSLVVTDTNGVIQPNTTVNFAATCGTFTSTSVTTDSAGKAETTYSAVYSNGNLCPGDSPATITATTSTGVSSTTTVKLTPIAANSIGYTTTDAIQLGARNSGSSLSRKVVFTAYANGQPAASQNVIISRDPSSVDVSFVSLGNTADQTLTTDSNGQVSVDVFPGTRSGNVLLRATLKDKPSVPAAITKDFLIVSARATQNGFNLLVNGTPITENNPAFTISNTYGTTATIDVSLVDREGHAVPDGTVVNFISEGGSITPSCSTTNGTCTATFTTQNPRSTDGRLSILAYVEGDKAYVDANSNNQFDVGEVLTHNIGDLFRDDNEDNMHNPGEFIYRNNTGSLTCSGTLLQPTIKDTCNNGLDAILRFQFVLGLAESVPTFADLGDSLPATTTAAPTKTHSFKMYGNSAKKVTMLPGSTISVATTDNTSSGCTARLSGLSPVPVTAQANDSDVSYTLSYTNCKANDVISITSGSSTKTLVIKN